MLRPEQVRLLQPDVARDQPGAPAGLVTEVDFAGSSCDITIVTDAAAGGATRNSRCASAIE